MASGFAQVLTLLIVEHFTLAMLSIIEAFIGKFLKVELLLLVKPHGILAGRVAIEVDYLTRMVFGSVNLSFHQSTVTVYQSRCTPTVGSQFVEFER